VCQALEVSRAGYYAWLCEVETAQAKRDRELMPLIHDIFWRHRRRYGARRIAVELQAAGQSCGVDRVAKLLKNQGLKAIQPKSFRALYKKYRSARIGRITVENAIGSKF